MKKLQILLAFLSILIVTDAYAQSNVPVSYPIDYISKFKDIHVDENGNGIVVGECGVIRETADNGQSWKTVPSPHDGDLYSVSCSPGDCSKAIISTDGFLYRLENDVWTDVTYVGYQYAGQIHWITNDVVVLENQGQQYYRSTDGGLTWSSVELPTFQQSDMSFIDDQNGYVFIDNQLYATTNTWASVDSVGYTHNAQVYDMTWLDLDNGWIFDSERFFHSTTDGGKTWNLLNAESQLTSVNWFVALSETHLVGAQVTTSRIESTDGGVTWARQNFLPNGNQRVNERYHRKGNEFFLVGNQSQLLYSESGFTDFYEIGAFDRQGRIAPIAFMSDDIGYGLASQDLKITLDGGLSWSTTTLPLIGRDMNILPNGSVVVLSNSNSIISNDQGATFEDWIPEAMIPENEDPLKYSIKPNDEIYLMSRNYAFVSQDGGQAFDTTFTGQEFTPTDIFWLDNMNGYAVGGQKHYMFTNDGGQNWTNVEGPANNLISVYFVDKENGWVSTARTRYTTSDKGQTWLSAGSTGGYDMTYNAGDGSILSARFGSGNTGELGRSKDDGETWDIIGFNCFSYRAGALTPSGKYFFTSGDGFIVRHDLEEITTSTQQPSRSINNIQSLVAYPNPTTDVVTIQIPNSGSDSHVNLYNLNGQLVHQKAISNQAGEFVDITMKHLDSGLYIIQWFSQEQSGIARVFKD